MFNAQVEMHVELFPIVCLMSEWCCPQSEEIDVMIGKDREGFFTSGMTLGNKKCSVIRDSLHIDGDWTMDIRTKSQGGEPTYNVSVGKAGKGKCRQSVLMPTCV